HQEYEHHGDHQLVRHRVEKLAELRRLAQPAGHVTVQKVRDSRDGENDERNRPRILECTEKTVRHHRNRRDTNPGERIGKVGFHSDARTTSVLPVEVQVVIDALREVAADAVNLRKIADAGTADTLQATELTQQFPSPLGTESGNAFEPRRRSRFRGALAVPCDGKSMGFASNSLY